MASLVRREADPFKEDQDTGFQQAISGWRPPGPIQRMANSAERAITPITVPVEIAIGITRGVVNAAEWAYSQIHRQQQTPAAATSPLTNPETYGVQRPIYPTTSKAPTGKGVVGPYKGLYNTSKFTRGQRGYFTGSR